MHDRGIHVVTGGAGFIGSHLVRSLMADGLPVRVVDDLSTGRRENVPPGAELMEADVVDRAAEAVRGAEVVYHLAAMVSVPKSVADPRGCHRHTAESLLAVLDAGERAGVRRVVYASSSAVYGDAPGLPKREDQVLAPISPYAVAKRCGELYAEAWARRGAVEAVSLRFFNVFGPGQDPTSPYSAVIPVFIKCILEGRPAPVYGDGGQTRDFVYVEDVVRMLRAAAASTAASGRVYNVGQGRGTSLLRLLEVLSAVAGQPVRPQFQPPRAGDIRDSWADVEAAARDLGTLASVPLEEGLARTFEAYASAVGTRA